MRSTSALAVVLLLLSGLSWANPFPPTVIQIRDPTPSSYPGTGTEWPNEPMYINFNMSIPADSNHVEQIHTAFDAFRRLALAGLGSAIGADPVLTRFFDIDDGEQDEVESVYQKLVTQSGDANATTLLASLVFNNIDWEKWCPESSGSSQKRKRTDYDDDDDDDDDENGGVTLGYSDNIEDDDGNNIWNVHFCNEAYDFTALDEIDYTTLDAYPSLKMDSLARVMLHEVVHWDQVGPESSVGLQIVDQKNNDEDDEPPSDGDWAYGPSRTHALVAENPGKCTTSADSYAWHGTNAGFAQKHGTQGNFEDPPAY